MAFEISDEYTLEVLFTPEECEQIKSFAIGEYVDSLLSINGGELKHHPDYDSGQQADVDLEQLNELFFSKNLPVVEWAKLIRYEAPEFYTEHSDCTLEEMHTYKTIVVWLSDPNQYAGGDYQLRETKLDRSQGNVLQKQSWLRNQITPVEAGTVFYLISVYQA